LPTHPAAPQQVDAASNKLAHHLITCCGVRAGDVVGLLLQRSHNMLLAMLGILKAGGAYLPLDPGHPPSRTAFIMTDAGLKVCSMSPA
jgi:non-ribosomal peptide synthetase component F